MFVCACGFVHGGGSGHCFLPPTLGTEPLVHCSAGDPTPGTQVATLRAIGCPGRQQVALRCHQHGWQCTVTMGDTHGTVLSPWGTRGALYCHHGGHTDISVHERCHNAE